MRRGLAPLAGIACALLVMGTAEGSARSDCAADEFSERIDTLLGTVEGPGFPSEANLDSWPQRRDEIQRGFQEILALSSSDLPRRKAAVQALIAAESLSASPDEASLLGTDLERGEVRAWARRVLKSYSSIGVTAGDLKFVDAGFISGLQESWKDQEAAHTRKCLPLYQEKAAALRELACE